MNILHVSLGLPPLRTGGLTRYCSELMEAQVESGEQVCLVYPGRFLPGGIRFRKGQWHGVKTYELINPLSVALTFGVAEPDAFTLPCQNIKAFERLLRDIEPDIVHVHSFMGIYREFFQTVKSLGIPTVFTTHDYYPMCPRCTFIDSNGGPCATGSCAAACAVCCRGGMTRKKSLIMQSGLYAALKTTGLLKAVSSVVKDGMNSRGSAGFSVPNQVQMDAYARLLDYNKSVLRLFDLILTNSAMTEGIYRSAFPGSNYRLARISHAGLAANSDCSETVGHDGGALVLGYFGGKKEYKGYGTLMAAARILHDEGIAFELRLYGDEYSDLGVPEACSYGRVAPGEICDVLKGLDVVVVPSIYRETFAFVVLEALCENVRVVCSDAVGAGELVGGEAIFPAGDAKMLAARIKAASLGEISQRGIPRDYPLSMTQQVIEINDCYRAAKEIVQNG